MKLVQAAFVASVFSLPALAEEPTVWVVGIGGASCAIWLSDPGYEHQGESWLLGYWSGINMANGSMVGHSTDGLGIIERVKDMCREDPALRLADATAKVRAEFREDRR